MAKVKASLWNISNEPLALQSVKVTGKVDDLRGSFTLTQTYVTRKAQKDCTFNFLLFDIGVVTGFKVTVAGSVVETECLAKTNPKLTPVAHQLVKEYSDPSCSDALVCKVDQLAQGAQVQVQITFLQSPKLDRQSLRYCLPMTISPKRYFHEEDSGLSTALRNFNYELELDVKMAHSRAISGIRSPTHPIKYTSSSATEGRISINASEELSDTDLMLLVDLAAPISASLPFSQIEHHADRDIVMVTMLPEFTVPHIKVDDDDEEGHPDPREVLVVIDPNQIDFDELLFILKTFLKSVDAQILFNFIILSKEKEIAKMFHKAQPGIKQEVQKAVNYIQDAKFKERFDKAKAEKPSLISNLKPIFDIDCVSEDIPRVLFVISKGQVSKPTSLFETIAIEKDFSVFTLGLGTDSNYFVLNTMAYPSGGASEIVFSSGASDPAFIKESEEKIQTQITRIVQPAFDQVTIDWGNLTRFMQEQTPSREGTISFWNKDIFTIFGVAENPTKNQPWDITVKVDSKKTFPKGLHFKASVDPKSDLTQGTTVEKLQLKRERDTLDNTQHVRNKKFQEIAAQTGVASLGTSFFASKQVNGINVVLVTASDTFMEDDSDEKKPVVKYDRATLLQFQAHNTEKPQGWEPGEVEKGKEMIGHRAAGGRGRGAGARGKRQAPATRQKKLQVATQWSSSQLDDFFRSVNALLNKMSADNFEALKAKLLAMKGQIEADVEPLDVVVKLVFEKALLSPRYAPLYAELCVVLANELTTKFTVTKDERTSTVDFRVLLLQHCRENFERCFQEEAISPDATPEEKSEKEFRGRARLGANIAFIGELFLRNLLRAAILHMVIRALFAEDRQGELGHPDPTLIELVCKLFTTLSTRLESEDSVAYTNKYFAHFEELSKIEKYDMRTKFMIRDIIELRSSGWTLRKGGASIAGKPVASSTPILKAATPPSSPAGKRVAEKRDRQNDSRDSPRAEGLTSSRGGEAPRGRDDHGRPPRGGRGSSDGPSERGGRGGRDDFTTRGRGGRGGRDDRGPPKDKNAPTGSSRVDNRSDGWSEVRGGKATRGGTRDAAPFKSSRGGDAPRGGSRGGLTGSSGSRGGGPPERSRGGGNDGFATRGARGGGRGGRDAPKTTKEGNLSNAFGALLHNAEDEDSGSEVQSEPTTPVNSPPVTPTKPFERKPPVSAPASPAPSPAKSNALSPVQLEKKLTSLFNEFSNSEDLGDALEDFQSLESSSAAVTFVKLLVMKSVEGKPRDAQINNKLLAHFIQGNAVTPQNVLDGILESTADVDDISLDAPLAASHLGLILGTLSSSKTLSEDDVASILSKFQTPKFADKVKTEIAKAK